MKRYNKILLALSFLLLTPGFYSCVDDELDPDAWDKSLPEELKEDYSVTFRMSLDPMGGGEFRSRAASDMRDVEDFVDLEKVRVFFFTCQYDGTGDPETYPENGKEYDTGLHDYFLFESNSRWVSEMASSSFNASKLWQVTTPVFPYGNQDLEYNWDNIRYALTHYKFKIVILANRPPKQDYPKYDGYKDENGNVIVIQDPRFENDGPTWTYENSWANNVDANYNIIENNRDNLKTINDFHHCQYDPVYAGKNYRNGANGSSSPPKYNGNSVYDIIMKAPVQDISVQEKTINGKTIPINQMGTVSQWTDIVGGDDNKSKYAKSSRTYLTATDRKDGYANYYRHPKRNNDQVGGIPMYGVQKFEPLTNWAKGTPFNVSENQLGQDNTYFGKTISLLRSVVRLDLLVPKEFTDKTTNEKYEVTLQDVCLKYSNVMARVVPLDAATPTDRLWANDNCNAEIGECEWFRLQNRGPILVSTLEDDAANKDDNVKFTVRQAYWKRIAWYYGAWRKWWHFNQKAENNDGQDQNFRPTGVDPINDPDDYFGDGPYPHIFNPCVQRNELAWLDGGETEAVVRDFGDLYKVSVSDPSFYHYVVYTGERYINDPSNFSYLKLDDTKICFFQFTANFRKIGSTTTTKKTYQVAVTDYSKNDLVKGFTKGYGDNETANSDMEKAKSGYSSYHTQMAENSANYSQYWNWVLLRNHIYRFQVNSFGSLIDRGGINGLVISTEVRDSQSIFYE